MILSDHPDFHDHENIVFCRDAEHDLTAIIAIHSTRLGPAAGGCRMRPYATEEDALKDALRLSYGMSLKNAVAGLPLGGGKSVVIADPADPRKHERLRAFGRHVARLGGAYWTAIDMGVSPEDVDVIAETCPYTFTGASRHPPDLGAAYFTARGGHAAIRASVRHATGRDDLAGLTVAIQGCGAVGGRLAERLHEDGARLVVADVSERAVEGVRAATGAEVVSVDAIHRVPADVFSPNALGAILNETSIPELGAKIVCGCANNQLATPEDGKRLAARGVLYAPDFVVNAGGILGGGRAIFAELDQAASEAAVDGIADTLAAIFKRAAAEDGDTAAVARAMARERIAKG